MIRFIVKRDGRKVSFNEDKISNAIRKALISSHPDDKSTSASEEQLIEKLTNEVDNYTIAEIKTELGNALVEQISAEEDETEESSNETNFSLNINLSNNDLGNSAWDLVKRHKESK